METLTLAGGVIMFETQSVLLHQNSHKRSSSPCLQMTCAIDEKKKDILVSDLD